MPEAERMPTSTAVSICISNKYNVPFPLLAQSISKLFIPTKCLIWFIGWLIIKVIE